MYGKQLITDIIHTYVGAGIKQAFNLPQFISYCSSLLVTRKIIKTIDQLCIV